VQGGAKAHLRSVLPQDPVREHRALRPLPALPNLVYGAHGSEVFLALQAPVCPTTSRPFEFCSMAVEVVHQITSARRHPLHSVPPTGTMMRILTVGSFTRLFHIAQASDHNCSSAKLLTAARNRRREGRGGVSDRTSSSREGRSRNTQRGDRGLAGGVDTAPTGSLHILQDDAETAAMDR